VYEDKFGNLCIDGEGDKRLTKDVEASLAIAQYGEFNRCLTPAERRIFNPRAAQAYKVLLDGDYTTGAKIFSSTIRGVEQSLKRRSRRAYLAGGLGVTAAILVSLGALYKFSHLSPTGLRIWLSLLLASMGGFMSMSMGIKNISVDHRERYSANAFVGCLRIVIALISGTVAYLLVESKIVFAFLGDQTDGYGFLVVPFMAGFVESFVPNVLKQMDTKHSGNANADPTRVTPPDSGAEGST